jgi:hypothetical protein
MVLIETRSPSLEIKPRERVVEYMLKVQNSPPNQHPHDNGMKSKQKDLKRYKWERSFEF